MTASSSASKPPRRLLVIHNPVAGGGRLGLLERCLRELAALGCALRVRACPGGPAVAAEERVRPNWNRSRG